MKVTFGDSSFLEFQVSQQGKIIVILSAKDSKNPNTKIVNSVEIEKKDFDSLVDDINNKFDVEKTSS